MLKSSSFMFCQNLIEALYVLALSYICLIIILVIFVNRDSNPKCLQWYIF